MHLHDHLGDKTWLLATIGGLAFGLTQACADGKTHQGTSETAITGGATSSQGGAADTGGSAATSSQGGGATGGDVSNGPTGGVSDGGTNNVGGSNDGGNIATGGQGVATGGSDVGGNPATGGQSTSDTGGSATGGSNTGGMATGGKPGISCQTSLDCVTAPNGQTICDATSHSCVQCALPADCGACSTPGTCFDCTLNKCISYLSCATSPDCPDGRACDTTRGRCVDCTVDGDCSTGKCVAQTCRIGCSSDNACTASGMLCNTTAGYCVQCNSALKCTGGLVCDPNGLCSPPVCGPGDKICVNNGIAYCKSDGSGYDNPLPCPANSTCKPAAGTVACYGDGGDGGIVDNCAVGGDPCKQIPRFTGTQNLDGMGDDFCNIPAVKFDLDHSAKHIDYHGAQASEVATVRVAWSTAALSVYVDVLDASVQTVSMADATQQISRIYQGDSIELMISSSNNVMGLTGTDTNTLHVTIPAAGPAVSVKTTNSNGASQGAYTTLPTTEYVQRITATGYAIEMRLPWPGSAPATGTTVRFDIALNSADKTFSSVDDMRDGQLIYYLGTVSGTTTCQGTGGDGTVPFCDDRTWCSTTVQGP